jgi:hypothetical protein
MKSPSYIQELRPQEWEALEAGLRSQNAFSLRRCQILLASSEGKNRQSLPKI